MRPCRCLAGEAPGQEELAALIRERIALIPEEERTPETEYAFRLSRCRACESLNSGTCAQCGCYVEIRAARRWQRCPVVDRWNYCNNITKK